MLSYVDSIKLSSVKRSRSRNGGRKEASQTLTAYVSDRDAYACTLRARQSGSRPLAQRPFDCSETPASPPLPHGTDPSPCSCNTQPPPGSPGRSLEPRTSNLDVLSCLGPTPAPAPRRPTYGFCAHSWALVRGMLSHVQLRCMCMCWRGTLVSHYLSPPPPPSARITSVYAYTYCNTYDICWGAQRSTPNAYASLRAGALAGARIKLTVPIRVPVRQTYTCAFTANTVVYTQKWKGVKGKYVRRLFVSSILL